ncbi:hypothetical protein [Aquabacterium sp.]|uniref:hypothetical protein n=1 Tax=Aquabacterium sp. TaxID=1872578 RepID=UPI003D6D58A2
MNALGLYAGVISLASLAATVQPAEEPAELQAASVIAGSKRDSACRSAACAHGWQSASRQAIYDMADCRPLSDDQRVIDGCKAFVNESLQARLENQW